MSLPRSLTVVTQLEIENAEGSWYSWSPTFLSFKEAMDWGFDMMRRGSARRIEILQKNIDGKFVSAGIFDYWSANKWYEELKEAGERDRRRCLLSKAKE